VSCILHTLWGTWSSVSVCMAESIYDVHTTDAQDDTHNRYMLMRTFRSSRPATASRPTPQSSPSTASAEPVSARVRSSMSRGGEGSGGRMLKDVWLARANLKLVSANARGFQQARERRERATIKTIRQATTRTKSQLSRAPLQNT